MELPDEASSVVPEAAVATVVALGDFAEQLKEDGRSFLVTAVNPLTRNLLCVSLAILSTYFVLVWFTSLVVHHRHSHQRKLKKKL